MLFFIGVGSCNATEYPLREKFPNVKVIEPEALFAKLDEYMVVDVRSKYEFDTIRIVGAKNAPLSNSFFSSMIKSRRINNPKTPIVFYCNGITCAKSYQAAVIARDKGVDNVLVMDAGIFNWVKLYPEETALMDEQPVRPESMISDKKFKAHILSPSEFVERIPEDSVVIDVREDFQRETKILKNVTENVPLGKTQAFAEKEAAKGKTLLIYDAVGKQVRWLQYHLEKAGINNYYFMEGGVEGYLNAGL